MLATPRVAKAREVGSGTAAATTVMPSRSVVLPFVVIVAETSSCPASCAVQDVRLLRQIIRCCRPNPPDDPPYLVMEYLQGDTLAALIRSKGRLEPREVAAILVQVPAGLETTHAAGLIHRDIKPGNIFVDPRTGRAKITDFCLARLAESGNGLTQDTALAGTPTYMSPEQARGTSDLDPRSDIYSLGVTLYEALTGEVPFRGVPPMVFQQVLGEEPRSPRLINDGIPRDLETICLKAMAKEPGRRYQSAREVVVDIRRWQSGEPTQVRPVGRLAHGWRLCRRKPMIAGLAMALVLAIMGGVAGISWKWAEAVHERRRAERERDRAVGHFRQASEAVDTYLTQVSDNDVLKVENLEPLRRELLRTARDFYERFVRQDPEDLQLQVELGRAHERLGLITSAMESWPRVPRAFRENAGGLRTPPRSLSRRPGLLEGTGPQLLPTRREPPTQG